MSLRRGVVPVLWVLALWPAPAASGLSVHEIITLAQQQLMIPSEIVLGEMHIYRGDRLHRHYAFVLGRRWEPDSATESVRIDFEHAINTPDADSSMRAHNRYLLKRTGQTPPSQWLYLPSLRRVRITPYRPDDPLLQSHYLFYDLTAIHDFGDYAYRFQRAEEEHPIVEGIPHAAFVPCEQATFALERRGSSYVVTAITYVARGQQRELRYFDYEEIMVGRYRPRRLVVTGTGGRTEIFFQQWALDVVGPEFFTATALETRTLVLPGRDTEP